MPQRIAKINSLIQTLLAEFIKKELCLRTEAFITLTKIDTSKDLRHTEIFFSVFPENEKNYVIKTLHHEQGKIQKYLHKKITMRILPKISFTYDDTESRASRIHSLLKKIEEER